MINVYLATINYNLESPSFNGCVLTISNNGVVMYQLNSGDMPDMIDWDLGDIQNWIDGESRSGVYNMLLNEKMFRSLRKSKSRRLQREVE